MAPAAGGRRQTAKNEPDHGQGAHPAGPERHRALVADAPDARGDRPQAPPGRGDQAGFRRRCVDNSSRCATSSRWRPSRSNSTVADAKRSASTTSRPRRAAIGTASASGAVRAPARVRRRARATRVSRRARAITARAAASRSFEGGQMPLTRRLPKRGFTNPFREESRSSASTSSRSSRARSRPSRCARQG